MKTLLCVMLCQSYLGGSLPFLYDQNLSAPSSPREIQLVQEAKNSYSKASQLQSQIDDRVTEAKSSTQWRTKTLPNFHPLSALRSLPLYHLLNNLGQIKNANHLHVGVLAGDSLIAYLYRNQVGSRVFCVDWFEECPEEIFSENCKLNVDMSQVSIIRDNCFEVDLTKISSPIDVYFYDADHSLIGHEKAITYYADALADACIIVIDDWDTPLIRKMTFKGFDKVGFQVLFQAHLPKGSGESAQYVAVVRKPSLSSS